MAFAVGLNSLLFITAALQFTAQITVSQVFNYGEGTSDSLLINSDDASDEVEAVTPFMFYGSSETSIFVSINAD